MVVSSLNWYFQFSDKSVLKSFFEFNRTGDISYFFVFMFAFLLVVLFPMMSVTLVVTSVNASSSAEELALAILNFCLVVLVLSLHVLIYFHRSPQMRTLTSKWFHEPPVSDSLNKIIDISEPASSPTLQTYSVLLVLTTQIYYAILALRSALQSDCSSTDPSRLFGARHPYVVPEPLPACEYANIFVILHSYFLFFLPCFFFAAMPDLPITAVWLVLIGTVVIVATIVVHLSAFDSWLILILLLLGSCFLIIDMQLHKVRNFLTAMKLKQSLEENERNAAANHVMEMRHMIANVAHDLKTVSVSIS
jgi:hypothetical protein